jgi:hypothetical protein
LLVNFGPLLINFGSLLVTFGSLLVTFGSLLVTFGLLLVTFGSLLINFRPLLSGSGLVSLENCRLPEIAFRVPIGHYTRLPLVADFQHCALLNGRATEI